MEGVILGTQKKRAAFQAAFSVTEKLVREVILAERLYIQNRRRRQRRKNRIRLAAKAALILFGCVLFLFLAGRTVVKLVLPREDDALEYVTLQDAGNLVWLLADTAGAYWEERDQSADIPLQAMPAASDPDEILAALQKMDASQGGGCLTYGQARQLVSFLPDSDSALLSGGRDAEKLPAADWYAWFDGARQIYDPAGRIQDVSIVILGVGDLVWRNDGTPLSAQQLVTTEQEWTFYSDSFTLRSLTGTTVIALCRQEGLYAVRSTGDAAFTLSNAWTIQADAEQVLFFWNDYEISCPGAVLDDGSAIAWTDTEPFKADVIADITFQNGRITEIHFKDDKLSGRLLTVSDGGAQIEGAGYYPFSDDLKIYQLYGRMKGLHTSDLRIGYAFTDFVVEDGKIVAALVPKEETMEYIRVLIKTSDYGSSYHDALQLQADCDCTIVSGEYGSYAETKLAAGEVLSLDCSSALFEKADRIWIRPDILTGHISLLNVARAQGTASYRGSFELVKTSDGILAVNEVLLEEYLYAVVPSEMPASYPAEALKSQAVCARTYAYSRMCSAGLPAYGAHVDDSTGFQVYQNISENTETTRAVKETKGQVLYYEDALAEAYYYSTSCGYGADAGVWLSGNAEKYPYLVSRRIGEGDHFFEEEEPWFRWQYAVEAFDADVLCRAVRARYEANPAGVLTKQADGSFVSGMPSEIGRIREISVALYGAGGVAEQLLIEAEQASLLVKAESNIRYVLCDGTTQVIRQDGSSVNAASMLPSAFFTIETLKQDGFVVGYSLSGGGFGHGVGLSQNGARNMAYAGYASDDILSFFYQGCTLREIY